jgi:hypothetical protein
MPTPEENGMLVLEIYAGFHSRPGHVLLANHFVAVAARRRIPIADIQSGLEYAAEKNGSRKRRTGLFA